MLREENINILKMAEELLVTILSFGAQQD